MINPEDFGGSVVTIDPAQFGAMQNIDEEVGAPMGVRTTVGASALPEDKLKTLQGFYPDAKPWGQDNFVYTDTATGNQTLFNPKWMDMGDIHENGRMIAEFLGGSIGGGAAVVGGMLGPQAFTPEEIVTVPAMTGAGAALGGQAYDAMTALFYPHEESRSFTNKISEAGADAMLNAIGARAGELLEVWVKAGVTKAKGATGAITKAFKDIGATPPAGAISGSKTIQGIEQALSKLPASADIIGQKYTKLIDDIGRYAEDLAKGISPTVEGKEMVGARIQSGAKKFVSQFQAKAGVLYDRVTDNLGLAGNSRSNANSFGTQLKQTTAQFADNPEFAEILTSPLYKQLTNAYDKSLEAGGMTFNTMKALRTKIGGMMDQPSLLGDASNAELKQLYGALSDDMAVAAAKAGPEALKAMERANAFWAAGRSRIDDVMNPVVNKKLTQDVYDAAMSGAKAGSQKLRALKKSLPSDDWQTLVGQTIRELGKATPGAQDATGTLFSPATFMTNFSKLSPDAKKVIFSSREFAGLDKAMGNLVTVTNAIKETSKMANTSGTAQQLQYMQMLTGGLGGGFAGGGGEFDPSNALGGIALATLTPMAAAKLVTSPKFINWLAKGADEVIDATGIGAHLARLVVIGEKDATLQPAINEYLRSLQAGQKQPPLQQAPPPQGVAPPQASPQPMPQQPRSI